MVRKKQYDRFRRRIMFPIRDQRGRTIGFGGRVLDDGTPKYLNSPETPVFHKGRELYGNVRQLYTYPAFSSNNEYSLEIPKFFNLLAKIR